MEGKCDLCGRVYTKIDSSTGNRHEDCLMINDYITMTDWYKKNKSDDFKITQPNPYACRACVKKIVDADLGNFVGGNLKRFLTEQEWWK